MMPRAKITTVFFVAALGLLALCGAARGEEAARGQTGDSQALAEKESQILFERARDEKTGLEFIQLSLADDHLLIPYFHREMWSSDDKLILCERRGNMNLTYLCNWQKGKAEILDAAWNGQVRQAHYARTIDKIWFVRGREIWQGKPGGLAKRIHIMKTDGQITELSPNGSDTGFTVMLSVAGILKRIVYVEMSSGKETICYEGNRKLGHLQMCPTRDDLIMFADQHDSDNWQRMYTVLTNGREHFPFYAQSKGEWVTHECWTRDGKHVTFQSSFTRHPKWICMMDANGRNLRRIRAGDYWHCHGGNTGKLIAADQFYGQVHVVRSTDGQFRELTGKWTKAGKWIPQGLHSHPCLSRQERFLAHIDGRTGTARVRVYDLAQLEW